MKVLEKMKLACSDIQNALSVQPLKTAKNHGKRLLSFDEVGFNGVSIDSRTTKKDDLFFAIKGERFDGHDYIQQAIANGASGVVVSKNISAGDVIVFKVNDTLRAFGNLASYYREKFNIECIGITGSNGKTTTKEMLAACLQTKYTVLKTTGNFNNLVGLPLSLFNLNHNYRVGVFELGMSIPGEMSRLAEISRPQTAVFTNIAPVHLETMGSIDAIAKAKYELVKRLPANGTVILNIDDNILSEWIKKTPQNTITYGIEKDADYKVSGFSIIAGKKSSFKLNGVSYQINYPGKHNIYNAAAAIAASVHLGVRPESLIEPLSKLKAYHLRSEVFESGGVVFINDCYNANPVSMENAIDALANYPSWGRKVAVLGDMFELGVNKEDFHVEIGWYLNLRNIDALFTYGKLSKYYLSKFQSGIKEHFKNKSELIHCLNQYLKAADVVLVKGSRGMALEEITRSFRRND
ncbi:MAG: UDP-N-acetylmuramoyl-tripeptide--D-alanyl-D-alanine ligase [candidate division Zixibacteria bacterium]|nr:UDP-N-acetylmuramoyl-tripeptide--D-alanyl-D-alanine ligase [candidate division Zixibacteria bacterium]